MRPDVSGPSAKDDLSTYLHRQCIGFLGALLPLLVWVFAGLRPEDGLASPWKALKSVSAYYYSSGVIAFAGILAALAVYLLTYRGYGNEHGAQDRLTGWIAGVAAVLVAAFPTPPNGHVGWYAQWIGMVHYAAAAVLFTCFVIFSLLLFTRAAPGTPSRGKQGRNLVYRICGFGIVACLLWIAIFHERYPVFWPETLALLFFAVSWLVKGRFDHTVAAIGTRAGRYRRDPRRLLEAVSHNLSRLSGKSASKP